MNPFLAGFTNELLKLAAFPQHESDVGPYDAGTPSAQAMSQYQGAAAKSGLKGGPKVQSTPPTKKRAPTPMTTPNEMAGRLGSG